jgi:hypothetical protein
MRHRWSLGTLIRNSFSNGPPWSPSRDAARFVKKLDTPRVPEGDDRVAD